MYVRARRVGRRRYAYLVEGVREGKRVKQKTLLYLGPIWKLASGPIPEIIKRKGEKRFKVDWERVSRDLARIPLTFEELTLAKRKRFAISVMTRRPGLRNSGDRPRAKGELSALSRIGAARFNQMFEVVGPARYRLREDHPESMPHKTLTISEEAYDALARIKSRDESFTKVILRLTKRKKSGELLDDIRSVGSNEELASAVERVLKKRKHIQLRATRR